MRAAIVTGADHGYFPFLHGLLQSLARSTPAPAGALLVLDFGLRPEEIGAIEGLAHAVVQPWWWFDAPAGLRTPRHLGYAARPMIPSLFPGYDAYLWLDADISVQNGRFAADFFRAADQGALAVVEEADPSYRTELYALRWQLGNAFRCFGFSDGVRLCLGRRINSGAFALRADAPHWQAWQRHYQTAVTRAGRANLDQHALMATLSLDGLPACLLNSSHNWICARSQPLWDDERQVFCRPLPPFEPISVLHLAGRRKERVHAIRTLDGGVRAMPLSYAGAADT
ncbi:MAG: hypothetical protein HC871_12585 [Rhizobiales bacterium]|nr:hypothetical protein [Hyphomicrobiales bacterium]